jgi:hypothetical protein
MSRFLGIRREQMFSPGRVGDDGAILDAVADCLRAHGHEVAVCSADAEEWPEPGRATIVFTMCQGPRALARLQEWQARGVRIINSPEGILNCQRHRTVAALAGSGVPFPETVLLDLHERHPLPEWIARDGAWVKRGDVHATESDDVVRVDHAATAAAALDRMRARGIPRAVIQRHLQGTVLKFYAVRERYFHCVLPAHTAAVPEETLQSIAALGERAARVLQVEIYGGDCVFGLNGTLALIDLNDWPSYAACRTQAAVQIAAYLRAQEVAS